MSVSSNFTFKESKRVADSLNVDGKDKEFHTFASL